MRQPANLLFCGIPEDYWTGWAYNYSVDVLLETNASEYNTTEIRNALFLVDLSSNYRDRILMLLAII